MCLTYSSSTSLRRGESELDGGRVVDDLDLSHGEGSCTIKVGNQSPYIGTTPIDSGDVQVELDPMV